MQPCKNRYSHYSLAFFLLYVLWGCSHHENKEDNSITDPGTLDVRVADHIQAALENVLHDQGKMDDSNRIEMPRPLIGFYSNTAFKPVWSGSGKWMPLADSLYQFIALAENEGLFPNDYHYEQLKALKDSLDGDSLARMHAMLWTQADLLLTDGCMHILKDLKQGRLEPDSLTLNKDSVLADQFFIATFSELLMKKDLAGLFTSLQPKQQKYWELKKGIKGFVDSMDRREYTRITYPFKRGDPKDSLDFIGALQQRLTEGHCLEPGKGLPDSARLSGAIKKYQLQNGLTVDGKYGRQLISALNDNDMEKFKRIALTLDKYKQLPGNMPGKYIWVNIPAYQLCLVDADTVVFESKVICGKPETRTPSLTSKISDIITYPTWTVPNSIIVKQYLPKLKNNPNYISTIGLKLVNHKGEVIDPTTVNWSKYSRGIPYKIMQGSGDNNSLGVIKFNFNNPYAVYLHDTNQRYLFKNGSRALSHGCVRVQEWQKLAYFIAGNDSTSNTKKESLKYTADSIMNWIAKKEMHRVDIRAPLPLFIRYVTCEGKNGVIRFYADIYGEDKLLLERYYAKK